MICLNQHRPIESNEKRDIGTMKYFTLLFKGGNLLCTSRFGSEYEANNYDDKMMLNNYNNI